MKNYGPLQNNIFPRLLHEMIEGIPSTDENLKSGFRATGIYSFKPEEVLKKIPNYYERSSTSTNDNNVTGWSEAFITTLHAPRFGRETGSRTGRGPKINIPAGRSIRSKDITQESEEEPESVSGES